MCFLALQPAVRGWALAAHSKTGQVGLVPQNYVRVIGKNAGRPVAENEPAAAAEPEAVPDEELNRLFGGNEP